MRILEIGNLNRMGEQFALIFKDLGHKSDILLYSQACKPLTTKIKCYNTYHNWEDRFFHPINEIPKTYFLYKRMKELQDKYDLFHCQFSLQPIMIANFLGVKYIAHVRGNDIQGNFNTSYGWYLRDSFKNAEMIWCSIPHLVKIGNRLNKKTYWVSNVVRTEIYKPIKVNVFDKSKFNIFMPSRQVWYGATRKDSFRAFYALKSVLKNRKESVLHVVEHGPHVQKSKELVKKLGLEKNVIWHKLILDEDKLVAMYNSADIIWDDLSDVPILSMITLEAMACNKPCINKIVDDKYYPEKPPVIQAKTTEQIVKKTLTAPKEYNGRRWIQKYYSYKSVKEKIKELIGLIS